MHKSFHQQRGSCTPFASKSKTDRIVVPDPTAEHYIQKNSSGQASLDRMVCEEIGRSGDRIRWNYHSGGYFFSPPPYTRRFILAPLMLCSDRNLMAGINNSALSGERSKFVESPHQVAIPSAGHSVHTSFEFFLKHYACQEKMEEENSIS